MNFNDLKKELEAYSANKMVFVGLGNRLRKDDSAGLVIMDKIAREKDFHAAHFIKAYTTPENYLENILRLQPDIVIIIDTAYWGGLPGEISWIKNKDIDTLTISTHTYSITFIEKYLKLNSELEVKYLVIEPLTVDIGLPVSELIKNKINHFFS
jgi:hydrogenase 3 maturation protease